MPWSVIANHGRCGSCGTRPTFSEPADPVPYIDRLGTAIATLHDGAANRTTGGFGHWVASLTVSLLSLRSVVVWLLDEVSGQLRRMAHTGSTPPRFPQRSRAPTVRSCGT